MYMRWANVGLGHLSQSLLAHWASVLCPHTRCFLQRPLFPIIWQILGLLCGGLIVPKVLLILLLLMPLMLSAEDVPTPVLVLSDQQMVFAGSPSASFLEDPSRALTLSDVLSPPYASQFSPNQKRVLNFGRSQSAWWVKLRIVDRSSQKWYLRLSAMLGEDFDLYALPVAESGAGPESAAKLVTAQYFTRLDDFRRYAWSVNLPENQPIDLYMRATNGSSIVVVPVEFVNSDVMIASSNQNYRLYGAVYIGILVIAIYQFLMFLILHESTYLALTISALGSLITTHNSNPIFESLRVFGDTGSYFFLTPLLIAGAATLVYTRSILSIDGNEMPKINRTFNWMIAVAMGLIVITGAHPDLATIVLMLGALLLPFIAGVSLYIAVKKRSSVAAYFFLIFMIPLLVNLINLYVIVVTPDERDASTDTYSMVATLGFMLALAVVHAWKARLERDKLREIEVLAKAKDDFLAVMSHELRTPMNAIVGLSALLKLSDLNKTQAGYVEKLGLASGYMMQLISNVLDFAKVKNKRFKLAHEAFSLEVAIRSTCNIVSQAVEQKDLSLALESDDLHGVNVMGDRGHLSQVLINLLINSVKYTEEGGIRLVVKKLPSGSDEQLHIQFNVIDTGIGISEEDQRYLFDAYRQVRREGAGSKEGAGLGLSISRSLVEQMGGNLQLESTLGEGSRFFFELLFEITNEAVTPELEAFELSDFALPKGVQILLTDDSLLNRYVGAEMIQNMGGDVTLASSGESATVLLQQRTFDVVLMDINLPGKDGLEISRWIRKYALNPTVPVIALTAHDLSEVRQQCQDAGMDDFLAKPFEYQDLYRVISQVLDRPTVRQV